MAEAESAKFLRKKTKAGELSLDLHEKALVVEYEVEATVLSGDGTEIKKDRKMHTKRITVSKMGENTDLDALAGEILERCPIIQSSKVHQVRDLLRQLQEYVVEEQRSAPSAREVLERREEENRSRRQSQKKAYARQQQLQEKARQLESASMDKIEEYTDEFYEDDESLKLHATSMILQLAKTAGNLEDLTQNERTMSALSRMLREECFKSTELVANILYVFYAISDFSQLHRFLVNHQIGYGTMAALKHEMERQQQRLAEMEQLEELAAKQQASETEAEGKSHEAKDNLPDDKETKANGLFGLEDYDSQYNTNTAVQSRRGSNASEQGPINIEHERRKTKSMLTKQERVYFVAFHLLLNLAEDTEIERKMVKKKLVDYLDNVLDRTNAELLIVAVTFLKKISIFNEAKDKIASLNVVEKLVKFVPCSNEKLMHLVLRLLYNLSFDSELRNQMVKNSIIPKLVELLKKPAFRSVTIRLLYHLSADDKCKSMFTYTEAIPYVTQLVIHMRQKVVPKELMALAINLSLAGRNAELMAKGQQLKMLVTRVCDTKDSMLMKMIRNISRWTLSTQQNLVPGETYSQKGIWGPLVPKLFRLCKSCESPSLLVEVLGTLSNLTQADLGRDLCFYDLVMDYGMLEFMQKYLVPGFSQDDVVLEVVMFMGTVCTDRRVAQEMSNSPLIKHLAGLLREKAEDQEIILQVLHTMISLLLHPNTAQQLVYETRMPHEVCELLAHHKNEVVKVVADALLDVVIEHDELIEAEHYSNVNGMNPTYGIVKNNSNGNQLGSCNPANVSTKHRGQLIGHISKAIRARKFAIHNGEWLNVVLQDEQDESEFEGKDDSQYLTDSQSSFGDQSMSPTSAHFQHGLHAGYDDEGGMHEVSRRYDTDDDSQVSDDHYLMRRRQRNASANEDQEASWGNESLEGDYPY